MSIIGDICEDAGLTVEELAEQFCNCEPCDLCEKGIEHEVGHECMDYICLSCDARDDLGIQRPPWYETEPEERTDPRVADLEFGGVDLPDAKR